MAIPPSGGDDRQSPIRTGKIILLEVPLGMKRAGFLGKLLPSFVIIST
jgi:hypothetical protein